MVRVSSDEGLLDVEAQASYGATTGASLPAARRSSRKTTLIILAAMSVAVVASVLLFNNTSAVSTMEMTPGQQEALQLVEERQRLHQEVDYANEKVDQDEAALEHTQDPRQEALLGEEMNADLANEHEVDSEWEQMDQVVQKVHGNPEQQQQQEQAEDEKEQEAGAEKLVNDRITIHAAQRKEQADVSADMAQIAQDKGATSAKLEAATNKLNEDLAKEKIIDGEWDSIRQVVHKENDFEELAGSGSGSGLRADEDFASLYGSGSGSGLHAGSGSGALADEDFASLYGSGSGSGLHAGSGSGSGALADEDFASLYGSGSGSGPHH